MLEKFVLKAKHWQIFISLLIPYSLYSVIPDTSVLVVQIKTIFMWIAYYSWVYVLGKALNYCIPRRHMLSYGFMTFNFFFFIIGFTILQLLLDPGTTVTFHGFAALLFFYYFFSFLYLFYFASKALTSAEKGKRTSFGNHIGEMFLLMFGFIGVWFIQPRVNQLYEANREEFEDE